MLALPYTFPSPLVTQRLTLRVMTRDDVDDIHAYQSREDVCRYVLYDPRSYEDVIAKVAQYSTAKTLTGEGDYWQLAVEHEGRVIGDVYFAIKSRANETGEIGWSLHPDFQGRGFMTEAASQVLDIAFKTIGLHRVMAELDPRNSGSIALCKRLGMREEAYFVEDMWFKGAWGDTGIYGILAREWR
jgi:RimJ/RimL family protein N-acetyltransferase